MDVNLANYLMGLEKYILRDEIPQDALAMQIIDTTNIRWQLISPDDPDQLFLVDIKESSKKALAMSLHHQDDVSKAGIVRVDYHTRHKNPVDVLDSVPNEFRPYAGVYLDEFPAHIHYMVDGYAPLVWAIPLEIDTFSIKDLYNTGDIASAIKEFCKIINVKTELTISSQMRIL